MGMTAEELSVRMTLDEFGEHWAEYITSPWGEERADLRSGIVASLLYNIHRGENAEVKTPQDYLLFQPSPDPEQENRARQAFINSQQQRLNASRRH